MALFISHSHTFKRCVSCSAACTLTSQSLGHFFMFGDCRIRDSEGNLTGSQLLLKLTEDYQCILSRTGVVESDQKVIGSLEVVMSLPQWEMRYR